MVSRFGFDEPQGSTEEGAADPGIDEEADDFISKSLALMVLQKMENSEFLPLAQCTIIELWRRIEKDPGRYPLDVICDCFRDALSRFEELKE